MRRIAVIAVPRSELPIDFSYLRGDSDFHRRTPNGNRCHPLPSPFAVFLPFFCRRLLSSVVVKVTGFDGGSVGCFVAFGLGRRWQPNA